MELNHSFTVNVPVNEAWNVLTNVERIAPCLPGAQLQEVEGDTYRGVVKVKVGPITAQFKGQANASALITAQLTSVDASSTKVDVNTDLAITGKVAQFGRGALADVSDKLLAQFTENLNTLLAEEPAVAEAPVNAPEAPTTTAASTEPVVRKIDAPEAAPINLLETAGGTVLKRALPVAAGIAVLVLLLVAIL
jgi:carbon monoxide dehydrogenase subunit G